MGDDNLTIEILKSIRDELRGTNLRVDDTNRRLDFLAEGQIRLTNEVHELRGDVQQLRGDVQELRGEVHELRGDVHELRGDVGKLRGRFDHFLETGGGLYAELRRRIERLEQHSGLVPT